MRQFIKQLRPRNELYTLPIEKVQDFLQEGKQNFLQEGKLTPAEVLKYDSRIDLFIQKLKASDPFELTDGGTVTLKYNSELEKAVKSADADKMKSIGLTTHDGKKISWGKLKKSTEFGGGTSGSGGGASGTKTAESGQCVYLQAIWNNPKTDFNEVELTQAFSQVKVNGTLDMLLTLSEDWVTSSIESAKLLYKILPKRNYTFHRGSDDFVKGIIEKTFSQTGQTDFPDINKWNPADIWIVDESKISSYDFSQVKELPYYNQLLLQAYQNRDIIGVSLKKTKKARFTQQNYKKPFKEPRFTKTTLGKRDFFKSKDGYMFFSEGEIQFRTFPAFQGEIIGKVAKHGKISGDGGPTGPIGIVMKKVGATSIPPRKQVTQMIKSNRSNFFKLFHNEYLRAGQKNIPLKQFEQNFRGKDSGYLESKYLVTLMFNELKGREQKFLSLAFRYAKSISANSSVHLKVY